MSGKRILVTGSRNWYDYEPVETVLRFAYQHFGSPDTVLVHGAAHGADSIARHVWERQGLPTEAHPVTDEDWRAHGKRAGMLRNRLMVSLGADLCLGFVRDNSRGTTGCLKMALNAGIPTYAFHHEAFPDTAQGIAECRLLFASDLDD